MRVAPHRSTRVAGSGRFASRLAAVRMRCGTSRPAPRRRAGTSWRANWERMSRPMTPGLRDAVRQGRRRWMSNVRPALATVWASALHNEAGCDPEAADLQHATATAMTHHSRSDCRRPISHRRESSAKSPSSILLEREPTRNGSDPLPDRHDVVSIQRLNSTTSPAVSRRDAPELCVDGRPPSSRGRRESRVRAAPAVSCAIGVEVGGTRAYR